MSRPNDIQVSPHFRLYEFEDRAFDHVVVLHRLLLERLELLHCALAEELGHEVAICITRGSVTVCSNNRLGKILGWIGEGGIVSRNSRHLTKFGGIAADFYTIDQETGLMVRTGAVAVLARPLFDVVLEHYPTHIHVDLRESAKPKSRDAETSEPTP